MTIMPMKKCKKCGNVFTPPLNEMMSKCPSCGSWKSKTASPLDLILKKK